MHFLIVDQFRNFVCAIRQQLDVPLVSGVIRYIAKWKVFLTLLICVRASILQAGRESVLECWARACALVINLGNAASSTGRFTQTLALKHEA